MVTGAFSSGFDRFYPLRVLVVAVVLWSCRHGYDALQWCWSWSAVVLGILAFALWMGLEQPLAAATVGSQLGQALSGVGPGERAFWLFFRVVGSVVTVPLAEEIAFRGYLTRRLIAADFQSVPPGQFSWSSFLVSSSLFGVMHGRWLAGILAGMLYALAFYRRGRLTDAVLAHATTNALIAAYVIATGTWSLWA